MGTVGASAADAPVSGLDVPIETTHLARNAAARLRPARPRRRRLAVVASCFIDTGHQTMAIGNDHHGLFNMLPLLLISSSPCCRQ